MILAIIIYGGLIIINFHMSPNPHALRIKLLITSVIIIYGDVIFLFGNT